MQLADDQLHLSSKIDKNKEKLTSSKRNLQFSEIETHQP